MSLGEGFGSGSGGWWPAVFLWQTREKEKGMGRLVWTGKRTVKKSMRKLCRNYVLANYPPLVSPLTMPWTLLGEATSLQNRGNWQLRKRDCDSNSLCIVDLICIVNLYGWVLWEFTPLWKSKDVSLSCVLKSLEKRGNAWGPPTHHKTSRSVLNMNVWTMREKVFRKLESPFYRFSKSERMWMNLKNCFPLYDLSSGWLRDEFFLLCFPKFLELQKFAKRNGQIWMIFCFSYPFHF